MSYAFLKAFPLRFLLSWFRWVPGTKGFPSGWNGLATQWGRYSLLLTPPLETNSINATDGLPDSLNFQQNNFDLYKASSSHSFQCFNRINLKSFLLKKLQAVLNVILPLPRDYFIRDLTSKEHWKFRCTKKPLPLFAPTAPHQQLLSAKWSRTGFFFSFVLSRCPGLLSKRLIAGVTTMYYPNQNAS